jgi:hypothetical protein
MVSRRCSLRCASLQPSKARLRKSTVLSIGKGDNRHGDLLEEDIRRRQGGAPKQRLKERVHHILPLWRRHIHRGQLTRRESGRCDVRSSIVCGHASKNQTLRPRGAYHHPPNARPRCRKPIERTPDLSGRRLADEYPAQLTAWTKPRSSPEILSH